MARKNDVGTVDRVISLIRLLAESEGLMSIRRVSTALSLPPSTVHRMLEQLTAQDLVFYDRSIHRYSLGPELYRIGCLIVARHPLATIAEPVLQEITRQTGEASILGLLLPKQRRMIFASKVDSDKRLRYRIDLNQPITLVKGASGRTILAYLPEEDINACIAEEGKELGGKAQALKLKQDLAEIRTNGYGFSQGSRIPGAVGFAVPLFSARNEIFGSLCLTIPEQRYDPRTRKTLLSILTSGGRKLSEMLGAHVTAPDRTRSTSATKRQTK